MSSSARPVAGLATEWLLAAVVGGVLWWAGELLMPAASEPFGGHGQRFAEMAQAPLSFEGAFPQRVLWPSLAWLFGVFGMSPVAFSHLCSAALLAVVFWFARRRTHHAVDALLATAAIAASGAVLVYKSMACFSDSLNLLLMVLLVHFAARPRVFWSLVLLSALSHEMVFFFWPWLVYLRCCNGGNVWRESLALAVAIGVYAGFRAPIQGPYGVLYYIDNNIWVPWGLPLMWALWLLLVLVEFGPLLVAVAWASRDGALAQPAALGGRWGLALYIAGALPLMLLAYDVMRFAAFALLPVLLGLLALLRARNGRFVVTGLLLAQCACYLWLHPVVGEQGGEHFTEIATGNMLPRLGMLVSRTFGDAVSFTGEVVAATWHIWVAALCAAVVLLLGGVALRRATGP